MPQPDTPPNPDWNQISSVFLDMDGTLLDLNYDNHFWREFVPRRYALHHQVSEGEARDELYDRYKRVEGTMDWYCVDYWSRELSLDIAELKAEVAHLIAVHPHVKNFLSAARNAGKRLVLVTNAHQKSLSLKMRHTQLDGYFDRIICSHDFHLPKEVPAFWERLSGYERFDPQATLLVDDSLAVLRSAREFGIRYLVAVTRPDSQAPEIQISDFTSIRDFSELDPGGAQVSGA